MEIPAELVARLREIRSLGVVTGAGVSQESGVRTYRGQGGIYDDPEEGDRTVESLTGSTLASDPARTWRVLAGLARQSLEAQPNPAHHAIAEMERKVERFVLLTQNVDGLHQAAGSRNVIDIHGNLRDTVCMECETPGRLTLEDFRKLEGVPRCPACGGVLRPDVVLFGEMLPFDKTMRMREELLVRSPDAVLVAGTTALFPYIQEPVLVARRLRRLTIAVNPQPTGLSGIVDYFLEGPAGVVLPLLAAALG